MNDDAHFSLMRILFYYVFLCEGKIKDRKLVGNKIGSLNPPFFSNSIFRAVLTQTIFWENDQPIFSPFRRFTSYVPQYLQPTIAFMKTA